MTKRKTYTAAFKAKAVLELLREEKPLRQLAAECEVHPSQLRKWKQISGVALTTHSAVGF